MDELSYDSYDMSTRLNARIDDDLAEQLQQLSRQSGKTLTEIIVAAIRAWTRQELRKRTSAAEVFTKAGFVGSGKGPRDLARNSKQYIARSLKRKA